MAEISHLSHSKKENSGMQIFCDEPGCNKSFKRTDHLTRHKRNHASKNLFNCTWSGCTKSFVRRDVWSKHIQRHVARQEKQKDLRSGPIQFLEIYTPTSNFDGIYKMAKKSTNSPSISNDNEGNSLLNLPYVPVSNVNYKFQNEQISPKDNSSTTSDKSESPLLSRQRNLDPSCLGDEFRDKSSNIKQGNIAAEVSQLAEFCYDNKLYMNTITKNSGITEKNGESSDLLNDFPAIEGNNESDSENFGNFTYGPETNKATPTELIHWMLNGHALYSEPFHNYIDYSPDSPLKSFLKNSSPFPISNYQTDISEDTKSKMLEFIPSLLLNPDFSLDHIKKCIESYWNIFHVQYPILHKPSFSTLEVHPLLLLSMVSMGAALRFRNNRAGCRYFKDMRKLADEIAEPLRWLIFSSSELTTHITPWVVQSLLIVECYENSCSNRRLHQRAYLHHGLKIQLLRRSTLLGGSSLKTINNDDALTDEVDAWKKWIEIESLKRCAFMAFLIDSIHALIYGHETILLTHQIKLSLPCDEILWEITESNNLPPRSESPKFLDALSDLLHKKKVETGAFNKRILFAGLLTIMFGMEQRDIQIKEFEWESVKSSWKETVFDAIEFWMEDMCQTCCCDIRTGYYIPKNVEIPKSLNLDNTTCKLAMYHLSQAFLRVKQRDCIIYAGAPSRMNVRTNYSDYEIVKKRIYEWANSYSGRISVVHAYLFISEMLLSLDESKENILLSYDPGEDPILYRPNVVASLLFVIWCYNYCLEGPESDIYPNIDETNESSCTKSINLSTNYLPEKMNGYRYISRIIASFKLSIGSDKLSFKNVDKYAKSLDQVGEKNCTVGLLRLFRDKYETCISQICQEYGKLLENCIQRSLGKSTIICTNMYDHSS